MDKTSRNHIARAIKEIDSSLWNIKPEDQKSVRLARAYLIFSLFSDGYELSTSYRVIKSTRGPELYKEALELIALLENQS